MQDFDLLIVMGGPMNVYETEKYFWLTQEKRFIEKAINDGKKVLGICLGAQLIADVLGAKVSQNEFKEIGWFPVELTNDCAAFQTLPSQFKALHWHGDTFDLPRGAVHLARSKACENQAFVYDEKVLSLQFHLEATQQSVQQIIENCGDELVDGKYIQTPKDILAKHEYFVQGNQMMWRILDNLEQLTEEPQSQRDKSTFPTPSSITISVPKATLNSRRFSNIETSFVKRGQPR